MQKDFGQKETMAQNQLKVVKIQYNTPIEVNIQGLILHVNYNAGMIINDKLSLVAATASIPQ